MSKEVYILMYDRFITRFMQDADVFERVKVFKKPLLAATVKPDFGPENVNKIVNHCQMNKDFGLVAIFDNKTIYYRDENIQVVSEGDVWGTVDDYIAVQQGRT